MFCGSFPLRAYCLAPKSEAENVFDLVPESQSDAKDRLTVYCKTAQDYSDFVREFAQLKK